jgi:hypothetical protein
VQGERTLATTPAFFNATFLSIILKSGMIFSNLASLTFVKVVWDNCVSVGRRWLRDLSHYLFLTPKFSLIISG